MTRSRRRRRENWCARSEGLSRRPMTWSSKYSKTSRKHNRLREEPHSRTQTASTAPSSGSVPVTGSSQASLKAFALSGECRLRCGVVPAPGGSQSHSMDAYIHDLRQRSRTAFGLLIGRFGFSARNRPNGESQHGKGGLVDLVELVDLFRGCTCEARSPAHERAPLLPSLLTKPTKSTNPTKRPRSNAFFIWSMCESPTKQETKLGDGRDE